MTYRLLLLHSARNDSAGLYFKSVQLIQIIQRPDIQLHLIIIFKDLNDRLIFFIENCVIDRLELDLAVCPDTECMASAI